MVLESQLKEASATHSRLMDEVNTKEEQLSLRERQLRRMTPLKDRDRSLINKVPCSFPLPLSTPFPHSHLAPFQIEELEDIKAKLDQSREQEETLKKLTQKLKAENSTNWLPSPSLSLSFSGLTFHLRRGPGRAEVAAGRRSDTTSKGFQREEPAQGKRQVPVSEEEGSGERTEKGEKTGSG
jgi:hypothetical protein